MNANREFKLISQKFNIPHNFSSYSWETRESVVLREQIDSKFYVYGEIAPTPGFPKQPLISNVLKEAESWKASQELIATSSLMPALSCMKSEIWQYNAEADGENISLSPLVDAPALQNNYSTVKRKIGLLPVQKEINITKEWFKSLDSNCKVRLDANGSLTFDELKLWSKELSNEQRIEFIEQPLNDNLRHEMFAFAKDSPIPLAIDETIVAMGNPFLAMEENWVGLYVIKPTLLNDWQSTLEFAKENPNKTIFSTVFESPFGYEALIRASKFSRLEAGISRSYFRNSDTELSCHHEDTLSSPCASQTQLSKLWSKIN